MKNTEPVKPVSSLPTSIFSAGEMGPRVQQFDWSQTALGPVDSWSPALQSALSICLNSNFPIAIYWGEELILVYNDAWSDIPGKKHPWALGKPAAQVWPEIWDFIQPQFSKAFNGEPGGSKDALLPMQRHGYTEECYFDFTFTPILGSAGKVEGVFNAVIETTYRVIQDRRTSFLQRYSMSLAAIHELDTVFVQAIEEIKKNPFDLPFCLLYSCFRQASPMLEATTVSPSLLINEWPVDELMKSGQQVHITDLSLYLSTVPAGPWPEPPTEARIIALRGPDGAVTGFMVAGISARRKFDNVYQSFLESAAGSLATVINTIRSLEHERKKAAALAEIDRAKTTFFSNISHEFRTPLTLLLGPVEESLNDPTLDEENKFRLKVVFRNALRMQKLVNTLLDFSRIEAGRMDAVFVKTNIGSYTAELASTFRSAIEKSGVTLDVKTSGINSEAFVDREMWEKIILNLLSNAFKYTQKGTITVVVEESTNLIKVSVEDTGIGIPEAELGRIFQRFHRVEQGEGRSQEGTGIGLAMVQELVRLHGGRIIVSSVPSKGSVFTIELPAGKAHLPAEQVMDAPAGNPKGYTRSFLEEAKGWFGDAYESTEDLAEAAPGSHLVLLAEDNADMRAYGQRLLSQQFQVITAKNGEEAFEKALAEKPMLVITDVMMPKLDGFGLLKKLRGHPDTRPIPVIFLSARAGEEAKVEGLHAGADDYLVKPFSARELLVRAANLIRINEVRKETEQQFYQLFLQAPAIINVFKGPDFRYEFYHPKNKEYFSQQDFTGMPLLEAHPELEGQGIIELLREVYHDGKTITLNEREVHFQNLDGDLPALYFNLTYQPWLDAKGAIQGVLNFAIDVTGMVRARMKIEESEEQFRNLAESLPQLVWMTDHTGMQLYASSRWEEYTGISPTNASWPEIVHPDDLETISATWKHSLKSGETYRTELRLKGKDGRYAWFFAQGVPLTRENGTIIKWIGSFTDIQGQKEIEERLERVVTERTVELRRSNHELQQFAHVASHDLKEPLRKIRTFTGRLTDDAGTTFSEKGEQYLRRINSAADRMVEMIEGVLNYSVLNAGLQMHQQVNVNEVIENVLQDLELVIIQKNAKVSYKDLPIIEGAKVLIYQLFYNLINNSLKFCDPAGASPVITITADINEQDNTATVFVKDNGIGFDPAYAEKIFDAFSRLNTRDKYEGTGLGLSLCKRIAERHGGNIRAISKSGDGAVFVVNLSIRLAQKLI